MVFGGLLSQEYDDLYHPQQNKVVVKKVRDAEYIPPAMRKNVESELVMNKPSDRHYLEAERIRQDQEEAMLRELDEHKRFAREMMAGEATAGARKRWWPF